MICALLGSFLRPVGGLCLLMVSLLPFVLGAQTQLAPPAVLSEFEISKGVLQDLSLSPLSGGCFEFAVDFAGASHRVRLWPHDVRAPNFVLYKDVGGQLIPLPRPLSVTYRGTVLGLPGSLVAASLIAGDLEALVRFDDKTKAFGIQALRARDSLAPRGRCVIYDASDVVAGLRHCGVTAQAARVGGVDNQNNVIAELACDADYDLYLKHQSSVSATQSDVTAVVNAVDLIFQRDVQIQYSVTTIIVRTQKTYTTTASSSLLSQFGTHWRAQHSQIKRDVAHLFTGKSLNGSVIGIAYLGVICGGAFGLSETRFSSNMVRRTGLTAHELGHNWGANHCSGGGCYIMCPSLGGCGRDVTRLNSASQQSITNHKNTVTCLATPGTPVLSALAPASVLAFGGEVLLVKGQFLSDVLRVDVGGKSYFRPDVVIIDDQTLQLELPRFAALGLVTLAAHTLNQQSNLLPLAVTAASPPVLKAPILGGGGAPIRYEFAGQPADTWYLLIAFGDQQVFPFLGSQVLAHGFVLGNGALDGRGIGATQVTPPVGALIGVTLFSQVVLLGSGGMAFGGATALSSTFIFY